MSARRGKRIRSITVFVTVDADGDEAVAHFHGAPMIAFEDRERVAQMRELQHQVAVHELVGVREVVFVRSSGKRFHIEYDGPDDPTWYRGVEYQQIDLNMPCDDPRCHRKHVYMNYAANRTQDAARGRKIRRRDAR